MRRRPPFPPHRRSPLGRRPRIALIEAQRLKEAGDYQTAANIFERLAKGAEERNIERAPFLFLQAAHCFLLDGQAQHSVELTKQSLSLLAKAERWSALYRSGTRAIKVLEENGQQDVALKMQSWLDEQLADHPEAKTAPISPPLPQSGRQPPHLPEKCPYCGASLRSDQVLWIDERSAECVYCGSVVSTDGK
jgi:hypothetical protein